MGYSGITSRSLNLKHISESSSPLENKLSYKDWKASKEAEPAKLNRPGESQFGMGNKIEPDTSRKAYKAEKSAGRKAKRENMAYDESNPYTSGRKLGNVMRDVIGSRVKDNKVASANFAAGDEIEASLAKPQKTTTGKLIQNVRNVGRNVGKKIGDTAKQVFPDKDTRHGKLTGEVYGKDSEFAGAGIREGGTIRERQKKFTQNRADRINSRIRPDNPDGGSFVGNKLRQMKAAYAADPNKSVKSTNNVNRSVNPQNVNMNKGTLGNSLTNIPGIQTLRGNNISFGGQGGDRIFKDPVIKTDFSKIKDSNDFMKKYKPKKK